MLANYFITAIFFGFGHTIFYGGYAHKRRDTVAAAGEKNGI